MDSMICLFALALFFGSGASALTFPVTEATDIQILHITDTHADPYYDISKFDCVKGSKLVRDADLHAKAGKTFDDRCTGKNDIAAICPAAKQTTAQILNGWKTWAKTGTACPCGTYKQNPPFSVLEAARGAIDSFAKGPGLKAVVFTGDFASHNMPGNVLESCIVAKSVVKATANVLNNPSIQNIFVMGNNDVIPKGKPETQEWLDDLGVELHKLSWLKSDAELASWKLGGFYKRVVGGGLCAIAINSNCYTPKQINTTHADAQEKWLAGALMVDSDCKRFFVAAHISVGIPSNAPAQSGYKEVWGKDKWEVGGKVDLARVNVLRAILDKNSKSIVFEVYGDLNKEYLFNVGAGWGFTAVGISPRGTNSPGFQRVVLPADASKVHDIESFRITTGCTFEFDHSFKKDYKFIDGITTASVATSLADSTLKETRAKHVAPTYANIDQFDFKNAAWLAKVRAGFSGCELAPNTTTTTGPQQASAATPSDSPAPPSTPSEDVPATTSAAFAALVKVIPFCFTMFMVFE